MSHCSYGICGVLSHWVVKRKHNCAHARALGARPKSPTVTLRRIEISGPVLHTKTSFFKFFNFQRLWSKTLKQWTSKFAPSVNIKGFKEIFILSSQTVVIGPPRPAPRKVLAATWQRRRGSISAAVCTIIYTSIMTLRIFALTQN